MPTLRYHPISELSELVGSPKRCALLGIGPEASTLFGQAHECGVVVSLVVSHNPGHWCRKFENLLVVSLGSALRQGISCLLVAPDTDYDDVFETLCFLGVSELEIFAAKESPVPPPPIENNRLLRSVLEHVRTALAEPAVMALPPASERWIVFLERIARELDDITTVREAILYGQRRINFNSRVAATPEIETSCGQVESDMAVRFAEFSHLIPALQESPHSDPQMTFLLNGRRRSTVFFDYLLIFLQCLKSAGKPTIVAEIGSGTGDLARLWLDNPHHRPACILIDWPQSLYFAEVFLRKNLPDLSVRYIAENRPIPHDEIQPGTLILCPLMHIEALRELHLDVVINIGSLQEMTEEWVDFFMDWLSRQPCRYFYSSNYFAQPLGFMAESSNSWSPRLGREWRVLQQHLHIGDRNCAQIIAEKTPEQTAHPVQFCEQEFLRLRDQKLSPALFLEVMDCFRLNPDPALAWEIITWCIRDLPFHPKELWYLAEFIATEGQGDRFPDFDDIRTYLRRVRERGTESLIAGGHVVS